MLLLTLSIHYNEQEALFHPSVSFLPHYCAKSHISYTMFTVRSNVKDGRKTPQIKPSAIFLSLIIMVLFKKHSFLKLDQFMRTDAPKRFLGRDSRRLVAVSDTTISRSLSTYFLAPLRKYLKTVYVRASQLGKCKIGLCVAGS